MNLMYTYYHFLFEGMDPSSSWWRTANDPHQRWRRTTAHEVETMLDAQDTAAIVMGTLLHYQAPHMVTYHDGKKYLYFWELIPWWKDLWELEVIEQTELEHMGTAYSPGRKVSVVIPR